MCFGRTLFCHRVQRVSKKEKKPPWQTKKKKGNQNCSRAARTKWMMKYHVVSYSRVPLALKRRKKRTQRGKMKNSELFLSWQRIKKKQKTDRIGLCSFPQLLFLSSALCRYAIISKETWPEWRGDPRAGIKVVMNAVNMDTAEYQLGKSKVFIKTPESVYK